MLCRENHFSEEVVVPFQIDGLKQVELSVLEEESSGSSTKSLRRGAGPRRRRFV